MEANAEARHFWKFWLIGAGIGMFLLLIFSLGAARREGSAPSAPNRDQQAVAGIVVCQMRVRAGLKAPSTASFAGRAADLRDKGGGIMVVISHVDAQNAFGAMLRSRYICKVDVNNADSPTVLSVAMER